VITVVTWLWGDAFGPEYVNKLKSSLARNLRIPHKFLCVVDPERTAGIGGDVECIDPPAEFRETPNCIRRMKMYDPHFAWTLGKRVLLLDLDVVIVDDITAMVENPIESEAPLALWRVGYPNHNRVYAGGVVLMRAGALTGMWLNFLADPLAFGTRAVKHTYNRDVASGWGIISDQAMLNYWMHRHPMLGLWVWTDEIQPYAMHRESVPAGARIVTIGHENKDDFQQHAWAREHWR